MREKDSVRSKEQIRNALGARAPFLDIRTFDLLDSTNTEAKRIAIDGCEGKILIAAREQSDGRGRMGRSFYSPGQTGAYFSILYRPLESVDSAVTVTCAASVAVRRAIYTLTGRTCGIKWVNDLYLDGRKVCGILTECISIGNDSYIVVGIGININTSFEDTELSGVAGSLGMERLSPADVIAEVTAELLPLLDASGMEGWLEEYRSASIVIGRRIAFSENGITQEGTAVSIDERGALIVLLGDGKTIRLFSGEISLKMQ